MRTSEKPSQFFYPRTVPLKYRTFRALIELRTVSFKYGMHAKIFLVRYVGMVR